MAIAREQFGKHHLKARIVDKNRRPLLDSGFGYHGIKHVSDTTRMWTTVLETLGVVISVWFSWSYKRRRIARLSNESVTDE
jgi:hypothetical protein